MRAGSNVLIPMEMRNDYRMGMDAQPI